MIDNIVCFKYIIILSPCRFEIKNTYYYLNVSIIINNATNKIFNYIQLKTDKHYSLILFQRIYHYSLTNYSFVKKYICSSFFSYFYTILLKHVLPTVIKHEIPKMFITY